MDEWKKKCGVCVCIYIYIYIYYGVLFSHKKEKGFANILKYAWYLADAQGLSYKSCSLNRLIDNVLSYKSIHQISCSDSADILYIAEQVKLISDRK